MTGSMPSRARIILAVAGLLLVLVSLLALAYAWAPAGVHVEQIDLLPTVFTPPGGVP